MNPAYDVTFTTTTHAESPKEAIALALEQIRTRDVYVEVTASHPDHGAGHGQLMLEGDLWEHAPRPLSEVLEELLGDAAVTVGHTRSYREAKRILAAMKGDA